MGQGSKRSQVSPFIVMDIMREANELEAKGKSIIHMEVGQPSTSAPRQALRTAEKVLLQERLGYTEALGDIDLAIENYIHATKIDPENLNGIKFSYNSNGEIIASYERKKHKIDEIISKVKNAGMEIIDISTDEGDLEDVFIHLTKS